MQRKGQSMEICVGDRHKDAKDNDLREVFESFEGLETADVALMSDDLTKLPWLIHHSRRTLRNIKQNISFALGLKLVFIILTLLGYASLWMAIAADTGATLLVIFNSLRLLNRSQTA